MNEIRMLSFDMGASNGRAILGRFNGSEINTEEIHRFSNESINIKSKLYWDILKLFNEIKQSLIRYKNKGYGELDSIGIDSWGVSFGLIDEQGDLISNPLHYRDSSTERALEEVCRIIEAKVLFVSTGVLTQQINTIFQLYALARQKPYLIKNAKMLLMIPDLFNYFLTGKAVLEYTITSTSQMYNLNKNEWTSEIIKKLGIPLRILGDVVLPGKILGPLLPDIKKEIGMDNVNVITVAGHDTASAVVAIPAYVDKFAYIICGTWSVIGAEIDKPITCENVMRRNFTNEGGVNGKIRFLRNITGLWIIQECKKAWEVNGILLNYTEIMSLAEEAKPFLAFIDADDKIFFEPGDMLTKISDFCKKTGQKIPSTFGEISRCVYESLAIKYRLIIDELERILGYRNEAIHIIGGGIQNELLCQFTANALGREVIAGPVEATVFGNCIVQGIALGKINGIKHAREIIRKSCKINVYRPEDQELWKCIIEKAKEFIKI